MIRNLLIVGCLMALFVTAGHNLRPPTENDGVEALNNNDGTNLYPAFQNGEVDFNFPPPSGQQEDVAPPRNVKACWKDGEPRGKGHLPDRTTKECPNNQELSLGLCYPRCGEKRIGFGPLCLDDCKATAYQSTSALFCCDSDEICSDLMQDVASKLPKALLQLAIDLAKNPNDVRKVFQDFRAFLAASLQLRLPLCSKLNEFEELSYTDDDDAPYNKDSDESAKSRPESDAGEMSPLDTIVSVD
jgi:hypothetical protein